MKGLTTDASRRAGPRVARSITPRARRGVASTRVLLMTSGLGCGHVRAAESIAHALRKLDPGITLRQLDFWSLMNPGVAAEIKQKYLELVLQWPDLYARLHSLDERTWRQVIENDIPPPPEVIELIELVTRSNGAERRSMASLFEWALGPYPSDLLFYPTACAALPTSSSERAGNNVALLRQAVLKWAFLRLQSRMEQQLLEFEPDAIVATQMVPAALASALKRSSPRWADVPLVGVLTDFGAHDYWVQPGIDLYCVPHDSIGGAAFAGRGQRFQSEVAATGAPLMPCFERPPSREGARHWIGIDVGNDRPVVLVLGGGLGLGLESLVAPLLRELPDCNIVVMAGHNDDAFERMKTLQRDAGPRLIVRSWTEHMENYISAADVVVGKSGGLTVAEVLACGRPLLVTKTLQGQETFNVQFLERQQVGRFLPEEELGPQVARWLADPAQLRRMQRRAWDAGRRDGAANIAARVLQLANGTHLDWLGAFGTGGVP